MFSVFAMLAASLTNNNVYALGATLFAFSLIALGARVFGRKKPHLALSDGYLFYLLLTHQAIYVVVSVKGAAYLRSLPGYNTSWIFSEYISTALVLAAGFWWIIFAIVYAVEKGSCRDWTSEVSCGARSQAGSGDSIVHSGVVIAAFVMFFYSVYKGGGLYIGDYPAYRRMIVSNDAYPWAVFFFGVGLIWTAWRINADATAGYVKVFVLLFLGVLLLASGNRGEVMYALLVAVCVYYGPRKAAQFSRQWTLMAIVLVGGLGALTLIGEFRHAASDSAHFGHGVERLGIFSEIGYTARPLVETVEMQRAGELKTYWGATYINAVLGPMQLDRWQILAPPLKDMFPGQGYSVVAESVLNCGVYGAFVMASLVGLFMAGLDKGQKGEKKWQIGSFVATFVLVNNIRNVFAFVPGQLVVGAFLLVCVWVLQDRRIINSEFNGYIK